MHLSPLGAFFWFSQNFHFFVGILKCLNKGIDWTAATQCAPKHRPDDDHDNSAEKSLIHETVLSLEGQICQKLKAKKSRIFVFKNKFSKMLRGISSRDGTSIDLD